jgi:ferredoxin-nitrite reductase
LAKVYLDYVNQAPRAQKKPRMKHLLQDWGMKQYLQQVNQQLLYPLRQLTDRLMPPPTERYAHLGVHPQRQPGLSYIGISLKLGHLISPQLRGLVNLSETFGSSYLRLTPWQTVLFPDIPDERVPNVLQNFSSLGLSVSDNRADTAIVACAEKSGCAAAATQTQVHAIVLANALKQRLRLECPVNIHLTGCPKSCAQPSPAEITLLGTAITTNPGAEEQDGQQSLKYRLCTVTVTDIISVIEKLVCLYQQHKQTVDESFGDFVQRSVVLDELFMATVKLQCLPLEPA